MHHPSSPVFAILCLLLSSSTTAQEVVSFYFPGGYEGVQPVATISTVNPTLTAFHIGCPTASASSSLPTPTPSSVTECGWGPGLDVSILSSTRYQAEMTTGTISMSLGCDYNKKAVEMTCTVNQVGGNDDTGGEPVTAVLSGKDVQFLEATVVEGASLLTGGGVSASASARATGTGSGGVSSSSSSSSSSVSSLQSSSTVAAASTGLMTASGTASSTRMSSASATGSGSTAVSTGSAAVKYGIQGSALLALAGAAAVNAW